MKQNSSKAHPPKEYYLAYGKYYDKPQFEEWEDYVHAIEYSAYTQVVKELDEVKSQIRTLKLKLKDQEYIQQLEAKVKSLEESLAAIKNGNKDTEV